MELASLAASFGAGLSSSVGPCAAPRYLALVSTVSRAGRNRGALAVSVYAAGLVTSYAAMALIAGLIGSVLSWWRLLYVGLALCFVISGLAMTIVRTKCHHVADVPVRIGNGYFAGVACGLVISPCCAPFVLGAGFIAATGSTSAAVTALCAFVMGHVTPVLALGTSCGMVVEPMRKSGLHDAITIAGGACSVALGLYYGLAV